MAMNYSERELKRLGDNDLAKIVAGAHEAFKKRHPKMGDIALPQSLAPKGRLEQLTTPELPILRERFTTLERLTIEAIGGLVYLPTGLSINGQREAQAAKNE